MENFKGTKGKWDILELNLMDSNLLSIVNQKRNKQICGFYFNLNEQETKANALLISKSLKMLEFINSVNERLCNILCDEDLTDEKLRDYSESLLPMIQIECSKLITEATEL